MLNNVFAFYKYVQCAYIEIVKILLKSYYRRPLYLNISFIIIMFKIKVMIIQLTIMSEMC